MAYTVTKKVSVFGNERVVLMDVTADATTQAIFTGLGFVEGISICPLSMTTTTVPKIALNVTASGAAANGYVAMSTVISGDHFFMVVYGR